ncbi:unnamed protein product [Peniophora sp. CBMAI 1063]|nr:unnamed protein product [Peniophora sp. CBMAI 1063]
MDSTLALTAPGEPVFPASPFMMQDINFASAPSVDVNMWELGHNEQLLPSLQSQVDLHDSIAELFGNRQPSPFAPQPTSSTRTIFGWRPSSSSNSLHPTSTTSNGMPTSSSSCLDMIADALVPRKPKYKPFVNPGRIRIEQACEACRTRKAKCDGGNPCDRCRDRGVSCVYKGSKLTRSRRSSYSDPATTTSSNASIPSRTPNRKVRSAPAPLHLARSAFEPGRTQNGRTPSPPHLPYREPPSAASSSGSFISGYSTTNSSARSTPMSADFPEFASLHAEGPSGTGAMRHSRQNSRTHPYYAPAASHHSSVCGSSASSFIDGLPPATEVAGWTDLQFTNQCFPGQPGETNFLTAGDDLSDLFNICAPLPLDGFPASTQFTGEMPPMFDLSTNASESSSDSAQSNDSYASFESSLMLEFAQTPSTVSADEESKSTETSPARSPEEL